MDPSFWQLPTEPPPPYEDEDEDEDEEPLAIEAPQEDGEESYLTPPEDVDDEYEGEVDLYEAKKILDQLGLPNYDDVEKRLAEPEMTPTRQRNYLVKVIKDAETARRQAIAINSNATKRFNKGQITQDEKSLIHNRSNLLQVEIKDYMKHYQKKLEQSKVQDENKEEEEPIFLMMQKKCCKS